MPTVRPISLPDAAPRNAVLITRPEPGASETAGRVAAMALRPIVAPMLTVHPLRGPLPPTPGLQAVLITSGNALDALPDAHRCLPLLAVGAATAGRARRAGFADVREAGGDATALAELAAATFWPRDGALLLATGRGQGDTLLADLRARGFRVLRRAVYATQKVRHLPPGAGEALADGVLRAALFFSADTARAFIDAVLPSAARTQLQAVEAIAIADAAAAALSCLPWKRVRVAVRPTQEDMLALLQ